MRKYNVLKRYLLKIIHHNKFLRAVFLIRYSCRITYYEITNENLFIFHIYNDNDLTLTQHSASELLSSEQLLQSFSPKDLTLVVYAAAYEQVAIERQQIKLLKAGSRDDGKALDSGY